MLCLVAVPTLHAGILTVTNTSDSGAGSLRQALADASAAAGADTITFATNLSGQTIVLTNGALSTADSDGLTVDATGLASGLILHASGGERAIFNTGVLTVRGVTFTGGSLPAGNGGGAIYSTGTLTNDLCVFSNNVAPYGGDGNGSAVADIGAVEFVRINVLVPPARQTVAAGANAQFNVSAFTDNPPLHYQWLFNGNTISGATNTVLNLTNVSRANAGFYSVLITNNSATVTNGNAALHVLVPENLQSLVRNGGGLWSLSFNDADGTLLSTNNLNDFTVQYSTNLVDWTSFTNNLTFTNGRIVFTDQTVVPAPKRFFRVFSK